jgi:hypothetical protein
MINDERDENLARYSSQNEGGENDPFHEDFENFQKKGWLGAGLTLEQYVQNRQLQIGIISAYEIGMVLRQPPLPEHLDFELVPLLVDLVSLAQEHQVIGPTVRPYDLLVSKDLLPALLTELQNRGVDISDYTSGSQSPELPAGQ